MLALPSSRANAREHRRDMLPHVLHHNNGTCRSTSLRALCHGSSGEFLQHGFLDPNPGVKIFLGKILVRRVRVTVRNSEYKQQRFRTTYVTEILQDRNAVAITNQ